MTDELKVLVEANIEAKKNQELERIERQIEQDKEVISKAIELINTHTLYKKIGNNNHYTYELVTEEMFKNDYIKEPKNSWNKGVKFRRDIFAEKVSTGVMEVNGETYYDIRYALNTYERHVEHLKRQINKKKRDLERLNESFPALKKVIIEWQTYEEETDKND